MIVDVESNARVEEVSGQTRADDSDAEEAGLGGSADKPFAGGTRPAYGAGPSHASH